MDDVAKVWEIPPGYNEPVFPDIPDDFYDDDPEKPKATKKRRKGRKRN